ncbi:MAG TPA: rhomboid family intramembrane serine protease [Clostridiales bacterium]|nr:rhomboid family intramembrane serine protease [Clostridiales bacterium]
MIEDRLNNIFLNNGYQRMDSNTQGIYLFYRADERDIMLVSVIRAMSGRELTLEQYGHVLDQIKDSFRKAYPQRQQLLSLILTAAADQVKPLATDTPQDSHWIVDVRTNRLIIYETQAGAFTQAQGLIEQALAEAELHPEDPEPYLTEAKPHPSQSDRFKQMPVTMALIGINVLVYFFTHYTFFLSNPDAMLEKGALSWYLIKENHDYYRILTSMFLHADPSHLFNNMLVLLFVGGNLERAIGRVKYLFLYFGTGILAGIASISYNMWKEYALASLDSTTYSIGASGAIFGVVGAVLWIVVINKGRLKEISSTQMILFVILSLYGGIVNSHIDQAAHVGGFLSGVILALLLYRKQRANNI